MLNRISVFLIFFILTVQVTTAQPSRPDSIQKPHYNGYCYSDRNNIASPVIQLEKEQFNKGLTLSPMELIIGQVPGLQVTQNSGMPGDDFTLINRNRGFVFDKTAPLLVVDGLVISDGQLNLPEGEIESITILKDLSATAIYGEMGSNGVILISTKTGSEKFHAEYSANAGISWLPAELKVFSGDEFRNLVAGYFGNDPITSQLGSSNTDWQKAIYRTGFSMSHQLSLSGTAFQTPWRLSVGNTLVNGIAKTSLYNRTSYDLRIDPSFFDNHLTFDLNLKGLFNRNRIAPTTAFQNALAFDPTQPVYDSRTSSGYFDYPSGVWQANANPLEILELTHDKENINRYLSSIGVAYTLHFLPDLKLVCRYAWDHSSGKNNTLTDPAASWSGDGVNSFISETLKFHQLDAFAHYARQWSVFGMEAMTGYSQYSTAGDRSFYAYYFANPSWITTNNQYSYELLNKAFFGSANFNILHRYMLNIVARFDGDSRYASQNQTGFFPSVSIGWNLKNEAFLKNNAFISALKFRAGYSITGVGIASSNLFLSTNHQYDPDVKREKRSGTDLGLEYGFLAGRIRGSIDYYNENTSNLLVWVPVPKGGNLSNYVLTNMGSMKTTGLEFNALAEVVSSPGFKWSVGFNGSYSKPVIQSIGWDHTSPGIYDGSNNLYLTNMQIESAGFAPHSFYLLQQVYTPDGKPIEGLYVDRSGEGGNVSLNARNRYHAGKPAPDYLLGGSSRLQYKNWAFSFSGHASIGNDLYNYPDARASYNTLYNYFTQHFVNMPGSFNDTKFTMSQYASDYFVRDASFFRMDYISLAYAFGKVFRSRFGLQVSLTVQNAFIITKYNGQDPELVSAIDNPMYPRPRTISMEMDFGF